MGYKLEVAPVAGGTWRTLAEKQGGISPNEQATFDPSLLENDSYTARLTLYGANGDAIAIEDTVGVAGDLKLGNFRLSFTDLSIPVTGIPITLTRTYDTLTSGTTDDFGYGWRMEFRDTDLRTSLGKRSPEEELLGTNPAFNDRTKVYITLPGGNRESFSFKAKPVEKIDGVSLGLFTKYFYEARFESENGNTNQLSLESKSYFTRTADGSYSGFQGQPFNPADALFGGVYVLTSKDGTVYRIDAQTGDLLTIKDPNGNTLTYTDAAITSSTGQQVTFERDAQNRITSVKDPAGELIRYGYDSQGDLISVTDRENNTTRMVYDPSYDDPAYPGTDDVGRAKRPHFLREIIDSLGRTGSRSEYDETTGRLKQVINAYGKAVNIDYDPDNFKQTVKDQLGQATTYIYDDRGNVLQEIDAKGGVITRSYDSDNNLLTETDADGITTKYTYDTQQNLLTIQDQDRNTTVMTYDDRGHTTSITSPTGLTIKAKYDPRGNLIESIDTNGLKTTYEYNANGQMRFQKAPDGQITEYNYDRFGNPNKMVDSRGNATTAVYDANGRMDTASSTFQLNGQTYTLGVDYTYDKEGRISASQNSRGQRQSMTHDTLGRVTSTQDILGNVTTYHYDIQDSSIGTLIGGVAGNRSVITRIDEIVMPDNTPGNSTDNPKMLRKYDQANRLVAEISPTGLETRYIYDELGRLIETILPDTTPDDWTDNPLLKRDYTAGNRLKAQTDIFGNWERYEYNNLGQLTSAQDVLNNLTTYTYTDGGQIDTVTDPRNRTTRYQYDVKGRLSTALFFDNTNYSWAYDDLGRVKTETNELNQTTTYQYDQFSQVNAVINALNERTEFEYDQRRNLVRVTDGLNQSTRYKYDEFANQVETTFQNGDKVSMGYDTFNRLASVTDERRFTTQYRYDNLSQLVEIEQPNTAKTNYTYDTLGRMVAMQDANQHQTQFEYDAFDRVVATQLPMGQRNRSGYDKYGQLVSATDFNGDTVNYAYDPYGRLRQKTFTDPRIATVGYTYDDVTSQLKTVTDGRGVTRYDYDGRDRLFKMTQPDTQYVQYGYDVLDNVTSVKTNAGTTSYGYDKLNRLDTVKDGNKLLADYDYDAAGNLTRTKFGDSSVETRGYDQRNRLTSVLTQNVVGTTFSGFNYVLDGAGNRTQVSEYGGRVVDYQYDGLNRLTQEKSTDARLGNRTTDYDYDWVGNRLSQIDTVEGTTIYVYDANDRLLKATHGSQVTQFTYDNNGSMKTRRDGTQTLTYDWLNDGENRLVKVSDGTTQTQYVYDAWGDRVATIDNGTRTNYLAASIWGLPEVLMEYDNTGNITADYTQGIGTVRSRRDNREVYHHTDGLGSTRVLTDTVGLVTDRYTYDAYGGLLEHQGTFGNSFQFAGEQRDSSTGLDYLRARYYDSSLGRFMSADAFAGNLSDPMSLHNYQYANANPTRYTDPSGYMTWGEVSAAITIAAQLSLISSVGFGTGYIIGGAITGRDVSEMFGDFSTGFANGISGGMITETYEAWSGRPVQPKDGILSNVGMIAGVSASILTGTRFATWATTAVGSLKWVGIAGLATNTGFDLYGAGRTTQNSYYAAQDGWQWEDNLNLLGYVPFALKGISKFIAGAKAAKNPRAANVDGNLQGAATTNVQAGKEPGCFVAGTEILTTEGLKKIEDIQVGDWVIADDPTTPGEIEKHQVLDAYQREVTTLIDIYIDGEVISATTEHPIWVVDKGWVEPKDLQVGDKLQTEDGRIVDVDKLERREGDFKVYNFHVEGIPTYFVSGLGILVHNNANCSRIYAPTDKHKSGGWGTTMDLDDPTAAQALRDGIQGPNGKQVYSIHDGKPYEFQPDNTGGYHGYPVPGNQVPPAVLKQFRDNGVISKSDYKRLLKGK